MSIDNPHKAVEIPIPRKRRTGTVIWQMLAAVAVVVLFFIVLPLLTNSDLESQKKYTSLMMTGLLVLLFGRPVFSIIVPFIKRSRLKRICTVRATGTLVGFDERYHHRRNADTDTSSSYYTYAPKYEIHIDGHYEIRTMNDYTRSMGGCPATLELLVNPDSYEITRADGKMSRSGRNSIIIGIISIVLMAILAGGLYFLYQLNPLF